MEISNVFKEMKYRPERTIIFASWGSEEHGLMGSHEFVEEFYSELRERAVMYINADTIIKGNTHFTADSIPILHDFIHDTAKMIPDHFQPGLTVYDTWASHQTDEQTGLPFIGEPKVKSD